MNRPEPRFVSRAFFLTVFGMFILSGCAAPENNDKAEIDNRESTDSTTTVNTTESTTAAQGETTTPTAAQWEALRKCEAGGSYTISNPNGLYHGAYQFNQATWDGTAQRAERPDLVGVKPTQASPADQDAMALTLYKHRGSQPWPRCGRHLG